MPEVKYLKTERQKREERERLLDMAFRSAMAEGMERSGCTLPELISLLDISPPTLRGKRKNPSGFKLSELRLIIKRLNLTEEQVIEFLGMKRRA